MNSYVNKYLGDDRPLPTSYLEHHGVLGQKWGVRRYQNKDGGLTTAGRLRRAVKGGGRAVGKAVRGGARNVGKAVRNATDIKRIKSRMEKSAEARKARKAKAEKAKQDRIAAAIKKATENGDISALYKYRKNMTDKQINEAINRIDAMTNLETRFKEGRPAPMSKKEYKSYTKALMKGDSEGLSKHLSKMTLSEIKSANARLLAMATLKNGGVAPKGGNGGKGGKGGNGDGGLPNDYYDYTGDVTPLFASSIGGVPIVEFRNSQGGKSSGVGAKVAKTGVKVAKIGAKAGVKVAKGTAKAVASAAKGIYGAIHPTEYMANAFGDIDLDDLYK